MPMMMMPDDQQHDHYDPTNMMMMGRGVSGAGLAGAPCHMDMGDFRPVDRMQKEVSGNIQVAETHTMDPNPVKIQKIKIVKSKSKLKPADAKGGGGSTKISSTSSSIKNIVKKTFGIPTGSTKNKIVCNAWDADDVSVLGMEGW
jgi:hypothetical protein